DRDGRQEMQQLPEHRKHAPEKEGGDRGQDCGAGWVHFRVIWRGTDTNPSGNVSRWGTLVQSGVVGSAKTGTAEFIPHRRIQTPCEAKRNEFRGPSPHVGCAWQRPHGWPISAHVFRASFHPALRDGPGPCRQPAVGGSLSESG